MRMSSLLLVMCSSLLFVSSASDIKQITHDDDVLMKYSSDNTNTNNDGSIFLQRKAKPDASFKEKIGRGILTDDSNRRQRRRSLLEGIVHQTCT